MGLSETKKLGIFMQLIRIESLVLIAFVMFTFRYGVMGLFLRMHGLTFPVDRIDFICLVLCVLFTMAAGSIINDYFDVRSDRITRPSRVIIGRFISRSQAIFYHSLFNFLAVSLGTYFCLRQGLFIWIFLPLLVTVFLWFYSFYLKRRLLIGNLLLALLAASLPFLVIYPDLYKLKQTTSDLDIVLGNLWFYVALYAFFYFVLIFCCGVIKNIINAAGHSQMGYRTEAVTLGLPGAKRTMMIPLVALQIFMPLLVFYFFASLNIPGLILLGLIGMECLITLILFFIVKQNPRKALKALTLTMTLGVFCVWVIYFSMLYGNGISF